MNVLRNKHFVVAMVVAPVLAVLGYFALDLLVGERPQPAVEGHSYPLVEKPNCRYDSGRCAPCTATNSHFVMVRPTWC